MKSSLKISYAGYFTSLGGFGIANIAWVKYLKRLGVDVSVHAKFNPQPGTIEWNILTEEERAIFQNAYEVRRIGIVETTPFDFHTLNSEIRIANTMCESDHVSKTWADKLNSMDYVIVPNIFNKDAFISSGVSRDKIRIIPHGLDYEKFPYVQRPKREVFTFGIVGYLEETDRKGAFDLIRAFSSEFEATEPVQLLLKTSNPIFSYYSRFTDPRIKTISNNMTIEELNKLYFNMDCFVFPSKAEGVGYPPREAMSTGLPVILTDWSGLEDISYKAISYPIKPSKLVPRPGYNEQDGSWANIEIEELMYQMRYVYEHQDEARQKGKDAALFIRKNFDWLDCADKLKEFLETL